MGPSKMTPVPSYNLVFTTGDHAVHRSPMTVYSVQVAPNALFICSRNMQRLRPDQPWL